jgi:branched-chain amino acid transport system substrate-binding protein
MVRVVCLTLEGNLETGIRVACEWGEEDKRTEGRITSSLAPNPQIRQLYTEWQQRYRSLEEIYRNSRLKRRPPYQTSQEECDRFANDLTHNLNQWLNSDSDDFRRIRDKLVAELNRHSDVRVLIRTNDPLLQRIPWHRWDFWQQNSSTEIAIAPANHDVLPPITHRNRIRILAILGHSPEINIAIDEKLLQKLPNLDPASCFLKQPTRQQLENKLRDSIGWDILFFAGHSHSETNNETGRIYINDIESLTLEELKNALRNAIQNGLKLAIFNSCDGLGFANALADLHIPYSIVMREPVPDEVAHQFLQFFLQEFVREVSLNCAVRVARERLESLEDKLPYATWLPVIYQHPNARALTWKKMLKQPVLQRKFSFFLGLAFVVAGIFTTIAIAILSEPDPQGDFLSSGEEILDKTAAPRLKQRGVALIAECQEPSRNYLNIFQEKIRLKRQNCFATQKNYRAAVELLKSSWQEEKDPETLIYLNNALLEATKAEYYTIAVTVPILKYPDGSTKNADLARELLRGIAQGQTEVNLGLIENDVEPSQNFPGRTFFKGQTIRGKGLKITIADDANLVKEAIQRAKMLVKQPNILGVVGHYASDMTVETVDIYNDNKLVLMSSGSTTEELTQLNRKFFFRTVYAARNEAQSLAQYLLQVGQKQVVGFYNPSSPFTSSFWQEFEQRFTAKGGKIVKEFDLSADNFDVTKAIQEVRKMGEIALALIPDGQVTDALDNAIAAVHANQGRNLIVGSWGLYHPKTLAAMQNITRGQSVKELLISVSWHPLSSPNREFPRQALQLWGGSVNPRTALAYDAVRAFVRAMEMQERPTRRGMQQTLARDDFKAYGATGTIAFESNGNRKNPPTELVRVVPCDREQYGFTFVPISYPTAAAAGLICQR